MLSTPREPTSTLSAVTDPSYNPHAQYPPPPQYPSQHYSPQPYQQQPDPSGSFYLNQMGGQPPQPHRKHTSPWTIVGISVAVFLAVALVVGVAMSAADPAPTAGTTTATPAATGSTVTAGPATPQAVTASLGETLVLTTYADEVHYTLSPATKSFTRTKYGTKPEKGQFFVLTLTAKILKGSAFVYGGDFALITKAGQPYTADVSLHFDGGLDGVEANAGQTVTGLVVWDIPAGVQAGAKIELREGFGGGDQGFWQLP
jgi:hypothetical protein